jgi:hypothetical protein
VTGNRKGGLWVEIGTRNENGQHFPLKYSSVIFTAGFLKWEKKEHFKNTE